MPRWFTVVAAGALFLAGCVTDDQVKTIVRDSNYQMLLASAPGLELGGVSADGKGDSSAEEASARLTAFLEANKADPVMANALRFRQTLLYLNQRALALADAAFQQVDPQALRSPRDKAIFAAYADLRWWSEFSLAAPVTFFSSQKDAAVQHMRSLAQHADNVAALPDLRDYFLEMRAWIGLKLGLASADLNFSVSTLQNAVSIWTATFSPAELEVLNSANFTGAKPLDLSTRRVIRARVLLTTLASQTRGAPNAQLIFGQEAVNKFYASLPH
jgi:hypothetical protein